MADNSGLATASMLEIVNETQSRIQPRVIVSVSSPRILTLEKESFLYFRRGEQSTLYIL